MHTRKRGGRGMEIQLICVGYAGSTAANFNLLAPYFAGEVLFSAVEYRGRGRRVRDGGYADNGELVRDVAGQIKELRRGELPYAILGYSMGAQVVYELSAQGLLEENPLCIFLAAHEPPDVPCAGKEIDLGDGEAFLERVIKYGGMDLRLLQDARFADVFLARMRGDFRLLQEYKFSGVYHKFPARVIVFYCEEDTPYHIMGGWQRFSQEEILFFPIGNSHFFFRTDTEEFCGIIKQQLKKSLFELRNF